MLLHCPVFINGKTREINRSSFFHKIRNQANHCVVTNVEVLNGVLSCNLRKKNVTVSICQSVSNPVNLTEFAVEFSFMPEINNAHLGWCLQAN